MQRKKIPQNGASESTEDLDIELDINNELTDKQKLFCLYYIKSFNATQSAIKAGYSLKTASEVGYQLLQKTSVQSETSEYEFHIFGCSKKSSQFKF